MEREMTVIANFEFFNGEIGRIRKAQLDADDPSKRFIKVLAECP